MPGIDIADPERTETSKRIAAPAEGLAGGRLELADLFPDRLHQARRQLIFLEIVETGLGRNDEAGWHVDTDLRHFAEVGALAAQQFLVVAVAFSKRVDAFLVHNLSTNIRVRSSLDPHGRPMAGGRLLRQTTKSVRTADPSATPRPARCTARVSAIMMHG